MASLVALSGPGTEVYISHGRNRQVRYCRVLALGSARHRQLAAPGAWVLAATVVRSLPLEDFTVTGSRV